MNRTLLIVSYHYAPSPAVGAKRFSFLAREFEKLGYDVHVITNVPGGSPHGAADDTLPVAGRVHFCRASIALPIAGKGWFTRKLNSFAKRLLSAVGTEYFWARAATRRALQIARGLPAGVVIATSPPHAALIAGARIARRLGWPLMLDYRDPWSGYDWPSWRRGALAQWLAHRVEARIIGASAARILNTLAMRAWFEKFFPFSPADRNFVIPNGFDPLPAPPPLTDGPIRIVHAGEIFTGRSLVPVLEAARRASERNPRRPIRLVTYGELPGTERQKIEVAGLGAFVEVRPRVSLAQLRADLAAANVLLAVVGDHMLYSTPYKVYDYMAAGRPILGLAPPGASLFELLADSGAGLCVPPGDVAEIERAIEKLTDGASDGARARVERFRWSNLALQYRLAIETVANPAAKLDAHTVPDAGQAPSRAVPRS